MNITRRQFGFGLAGFLLGGSSLADKVLLSKPRIIKPSLEEIAILMKKEPDEILKSAIEKGEIKKFEYNRQTKHSGFYRFLRDNFSEQLIFAFLSADEETGSRREGFETDDSTYDMTCVTGAAIPFLYVLRNMKQANADLGFLYIKLIDFYGKDNWLRLCRLFNTNTINIPSYAEFKRDSSTGEYKQDGVAGCGMKTIEFIQKATGIQVEHYLNERFKSK